MKVTIAAHACLMTLGLEGEPFRNLQSVLVYPGGYAVPEERWYEGWSIRGEEARLGEAWYRGPVILSWAEVNRDAHHPGRGNNLVWHEFAHQLDMLDRSTNGTPPLEDRQQRRRWHEVMTDEFNRLIDDTDLGKETVLDPYGAKNEAEFFAVATECFFDYPVELRRAASAVVRAVARVLSSGHGGADGEGDAGGWRREAGGSVTSSREGEAPAEPGGASMLTRFVRMAP